MTDSSNSLPETVDSLKADLRPEELTAINAGLDSLATLLDGLISDDERRRLREFITKAFSAGAFMRDNFSIHPLKAGVDTAVTLCDKVAPDRNMVIAILLRPLVDSGFLSQDELASQWGEDISVTVGRLILSVYTA